MKERTNQRNSSSCYHNDACTEPRRRVEDPRLLPNNFTEVSAIVKLAANARFEKVKPWGNKKELLGLMAIHLILLATNKVWPELQGSAKVYSDCLGALQKVTTLPPHRIPSRCRHSDILKNIMVNCADVWGALRTRGRTPG